MEFETAAGLFSPAHADRGTLAMLACADLAPGQRVLDLGCGWGLAGVYAALVCGAENVVMTDIDPRAAALARRNARKNGVEGVRVYTGDALEAVPDRAFDRILLNPPYQTDFSVAKRLILKSFQPPGDRREAVHGHQAADVVSQQTQKRFRRRARATDRRLFRL